MSTEPTRSGEPRTLADVLGEVAAKAHAKNTADRAQAAATAAEQYERQVQMGAEAFRDARLEHLPDLLQDAADQGKFEWRVWHEGLGGLNPSAKAIHLRGLAMVADWLREQGFKAVLDERKEDVPDYGYVHDVTLTAYWEPPAGARTPAGG